MPPGRCHLAKGKAVLCPLHDKKRFAYKYPQGGKVKSISSYLIPSHIK
jgi:hypothetical protein